MEFKIDSNSNRFKDFRLSGNLADVHFSFNDGISRVPAHKILLASKSPVFKAMFCGELKETGVRFFFFIFMLLDVSFLFENCPQLKYLNVLGV